MDLAVHKLVLDGYDSLSGVLKLPVDVVARAIKNSKFIGEYNEEFYRLNKLEDKG